MPFLSSSRGSFGTQSLFRSNPQINFYGDGSDGSLIVSSNTFLPVLNKVGLYDGDAVVRQFSSLTITSGSTLTTDQPCRGLFIYVYGNCTIDGTLSMKGRGPYANPTVSGASDNNIVDPEGLKIPFITSYGTQSLEASETLLNGCGISARNLISRHRSIYNNGTVINLVRQGAAGGARTSGGSPIIPNNGSNGSIGQTGGGGSGGGYYNTSQAGGGSYGSCFGGGSGGGGTHGSTTTGNATPWGGPGGNATTPDGSYSAPGGIGNGNGKWSSTNTLFGNDGTANNVSGTGGLIVLVVGGILTIGSSGKIIADGVEGPIFDTPNERGGGGASGGGNIVIAHRGSYINNGGTISANGGSSWGWSTTQRGGSGGNGSVQILNIL